MALIIEQTERHGTSMLQKIILILLAFILPPLPVLLLLEYNYKAGPFLVCVILTLLGHAPGVMFALYYILWQHSERLNQYYTRLHEDDELLYDQNDQDNERVVLGQTNSNTTQVYGINHSTLVGPPPDYNEVVENGKTTDFKADNKIQN